MSDFSKSRVELIDEIKYWKAKYTEARQTGFAEGREEMKKELIEGLPSEDKVVGHFYSFLRHSSYGVLVELGLMTQDDLKELNSTPAAIRATYRHLMSMIRTKP